MQQDYKYDVFISYSKKDYQDEKGDVIPGNAVSLIMERLKSEGINYWFDNDCVYSGDNFVEKITANIEASNIFVFLSTKNSNSSKWTCKEIATADEFGKYIIPVRIDDSKYNRKVTFRIADSAFIPFYSNPQIGLDELVKSIKAYLEQQKADEKKAIEVERQRLEAERRQEEERKQQEELDKQRRKSEQQQIITSIKVELKTLNNEETKLEADRSSLLARTEFISDPQEKDKLKKNIIETSPIRKKLKEDYKVYEDMIIELQGEIKTLTSKKEELVQINGNLAIENQKLHNRVNELESHDQKSQQERRLLEEKDLSISSLLNQVRELKDKNDRYYRNWVGWWEDSKAKKKLCWFFAILLLVLIFTGLFFWLHGNIKIAIHDNIQPTPKTFLYKNSKLISKNSSQNTLDKSNMESNYGEEAYNIGRDYHYGINGKTKDYTEAIKWYKIASDKGNDRAQFNIGLLYFHGGFGVSKDYGQAELWFRKAKELGNYDATKYLNYMIQKGIIAK